MNYSRTVRGVALIAAFVLSLSAARAQFATSVLSYAPGDTTAGGVFSTANILGGPRGGGASSGTLDVLTLGVGGSVTLGFSVLITDGPGIDLMVFENGFFSPPGTFDVFSEAIYVEVSSNGLDWARFPSSYAGPLSLPSFGGATIGTYFGLAGGMPILADVATNTIDPFDPVVAGGDGFDLADLAGEPGVLSGAVNLATILFVRLIDVEGGVDTDTAGTLIQDNGSPGSADIDAVAVVQHAGIASPQAPSIDLFLDAAGFLHLVVSDPDGLGDIAPQSFRASFSLVPINVITLLGLMPVANVSPTSIELISVVPAAGQAIFGVFAASVRDAAGRFTVDRVVLQG